MAGDSSCNRKDAISGVASAWVQPKRAHVDEGGGDDDAGAKVLGELEHEDGDVGPAEAAGDDGEEGTEDGGDEDDEDGGHSESEPAVVLKQERKVSDTVVLGRDPQCSRGFLLLKSEEAVSRGFSARHRM